eukprot:7369266-Alexandrium_andersonii.AAC.1
MSSASGTARAVATPGCCCCRPVWKLLRRLGRRPGLAPRSIQPGSVVRSPQAPCLRSSRAVALIASLAGPGRMAQAQLSCSDRSARRSRNRTRPIQGAAVGGKGNAVLQHGESP